jgi:TldD protein
MNLARTGNGRRQGFEFAPMPRMTNTSLRSGSHHPDEIIAQARDGLYCMQFAGGQVNLATGKFVFSCSVARRIRNGKLAEYVTGASLAGDGLTALRAIRLVGNDSRLAWGTGMCGKGQMVPVDLGTPTVLIDNLTIGGK